jgi:hypothetical protein
LLCDVCRAQQRLDGGSSYITRSRVKAERLLLNLVRTRAEKQKSPGVIDVHVLRQVEQTLESYEHLLDELCGKDGE